MLGNNLDDLLPITGFVHITFLPRGSRAAGLCAREFHCVATPKKLSAGEVVTALVSRRFAERQGLLV